MPRVGPAVWVILAVALVLRLVFVLATHDAEIRADPADYDRHARSIARGEGYPETTIVQAGGPSALRPPAYPYFLGTVYKVSGGGAPTARAVQAVLGTLTVALIGFIAWRIWRTRTGLVALGLAAVFPPLVVVGGSLLSEALFVPLELGAIAAVLQYRKALKPQLAWVALAGGLCGLAILTRSTGTALLPALLLGVAAVRTDPWRTRLLSTTALMLAAIVVVAPWTLRNAAEFDRFLPVSTQGGYTFAGTYNASAKDDPRYTAAWRPPNLDPDYRALARDPRLDEAEVGEKLGSAAREFAREHPVYVLEVGYRNSVRLLHLDGGSFARFTGERMGIGRWPVDVSVYSFYLFGLAALVGALTHAARRAPAFLWLAPVLMAAVAFVQSYFRFRAPLDPFIVLLAALAVVRAADALRGRGRMRRTAAGAITVMARCARG